MDYKRELDDYVAVLVREGGSDLHLAENRYPMIRVGGFLVPLVKKGLLSRAAIDEFLALLVSAPNREIFAQEREVDFSFTFKNGIRFRGNAYQRMGQVSIALRLIPNRIRTLDELRLPPALATFTRHQQGFFLVVGPVGHGKTTTLASLIELINAERAEHIITVEDPVEYVFEPKKSMIDQREVRTDTKDFHSGLINMLRQDVDVVMIGEMRGTDTMQTAVTAAETGHLVFSTLHTNNAAQTIDRIIDTFPSGQHDQIKIQLSSSLLGIFSQRLIPRVSGGLIPAFELLINNAAVSNLIREGRTHEISTVIETGMDQGMIDINRSLAELVRSGEITVDNAYQYSLNPKSLDRFL
ncbi:MAG: type IV pili twitching motility protein PilT [Candidatus Taylorbacteria bacterium RIFCSPHIGHO2_01_FULL_46_22b]|uniref:Type IV pili twitching motility protein PilT n=1 Tax=Candidatus Taylorbacteria bacterium RIFCSPHIGHO2_01_FULL_46_22b TaxID=1802301 RepID=A0A1G2M2W1_9BACT|nr:MAG: type IV pili twitching motility protein PilT [Candidatus Taylorbacteria bacterium RIFCSPHIGHO2_01_FULL_46_22b]